MFDGLWTIEFKTDFSFGTGVLVFNGGQVLGGDYGYYYSGKIDTTGNNVTGEVNVVRFNPNAVSVFGDIPSFTLVLKDGKINETSFEANATIKNTQGLTIAIKGEKKVDTNEAR
jgi:hypothetical protein